MASVVEREDEEPRGVRRARVTSNGQRLCYVLKVIQQPQRARACGSGAKSSADRRPVDPPPVVQLRIYDVKGDPEGRESEIGPDITFSYNANFFLFATLEPSRPVAHPRGQPAASAQPPVLTGMPVSGMAYLDRPKEAGYFIFPDLSVRHEGKYHLSFNLYEQQKPESEGDFVGDNNEDSKLPMPLPSHMSGSSPDSCFDFRMEAKSDPFVVYSAKKFPGLHESTNLSRTVAEQGCRVRIRRDVRMRRRPDKDERPFEDRGESQPREFSLPVHVDYNGERSRSSSRDEDGGRSPYGVEHAPRGGNLDFLGTSQPQFVHPSLPPSSNNQYQQIPNGFHPGMPHYQHQAPPPPAPYRHPERLPERQPYPQSAHPSNPPREHEFEPYRRASDTGYSAAHSAPFPAVDMSYRRATNYTNYPRPLSPITHSPSSTLPPLKTIERGIEPMRYEAPPPVREMSSYRHPGPAAPSPGYERGGRFAYPPTAILNSPEISRKRPFEGAFQQRRNEPLRHGGRPASPEYDREGDEEETAAEIAMRYKRADGIVTQKSLPPPSFLP